MRIVDPEIRKQIAQQQIDALEGDDLFKEGQDFSDEESL